MSHRGKFWFVALVGVVLLSGNAAPNLAQARPDLAQKKVGSITLTACDEVVAAAVRTWCGSLPRPWDPQDVKLGFFDLVFTLVLPATGEVSQPAVVGIEGGPGYGAVGSGQTYADMLGPLLKNRALLVVDQRGTGESSPIDCPAAQSVAACAKSLGARFDLYGTELVAQDLSALVKALELGVVDIYGDSYGTFVAQVFASHHPELVHSLVLDGAYPVTGETAWYPTQGPAMRNAYSVVCARTTDCGANNTGTIELLERLLERVRGRMISVLAPGADNKMRRVRLSPQNLNDVVFGGTYGPTTYRELNAALGAALGGDPLPLGRLVAESKTQMTDEPASVYSPGLNVAVSCHDYPQLFEMAERPAVRKTQYRAAVVAQIQSDPELYGPFRIREYLTSNFATQSLCLTWPVATRNPWQIPGPPSGTYPDVPTLVLSGELDTITTAAEGELVSNQFARARHVIVANSTHVTAMGDVHNCASALVREFFSDQDAVLAGSGGQCAATIPPIKAVLGYPIRTKSPSSGVAQTALDVIDRYLQAAGYRGLGLRGGSWSAKGWGPIVIDLDGYRLYQNLPVTGSVRWNYDTGAVSVRARANGRDWVGHWNTYQPESAAQVREVR
jgi:pimeloyl-ACP methyl ester carboxylesterase